MNGIAQVQTTSDVVLADDSILKAGAIGTPVRFIDSGVSVPDVLVDFGGGVLLQFPVDELAQISESEARALAGDR